MLERAAGWLTVVVALVAITLLNRSYRDVCGDSLRYPRTLLGSTPRNLMKSPNGSYQVAKSGNFYNVNYSFKGPKGKSLNWAFALPGTVVEGELARHGVPKSFYQPYTPTPEVLAERERIMREGGFQLDGNVVRPFYREMIRRNRDTLGPIIELGRAAGATENLEAAVDLYLNFCQDMPYGVPASEDGEKLTGGILPPIGVLANGWGDCDSKAALFAALMSYQPNVKLIMITVPGHLLVGVRGQAKSGQDSVKFEGEGYILCEPVGLAKMPLGKRGPHSSTIEGMRRVLPYND